MVFFDLVVVVFVDLDASPFSRPAFQPFLFLQVDLLDTSSLTRVEARLPPDILAAGGSVAESRL